MSDHEKTITLPSSNLHGDPIELSVWEAIGHIKYRTGIGYTLIAILTALGGAQFIG